MQRGQIYIDVAPLPLPPANAASDAPPALKTFVVHTPQRAVTAWGTKFAVHVRPNRTNVLVTQGQVQVSGVDPMIRAGQQLFVDARQPEPQVRIAPASRASYVLSWMQDLVAAAHSPLVPRSEHSGGALVAVDPRGQQARLSLRMHHVDVHIEDGFARTTIDQTYFNHFHSRLEGTFYFPLPADASISRLAMYVGGRLMEGGMAERDHARNVFETIKHRQLDPALLEWVDGSTFKMRVFPLEGRQEKRIIISYTQKLNTDYGRTEYRFPAGHSLGMVREWSTSIHLPQAAAMQWKCSSHDLTATLADQNLTLTAEARNYTPSADLVLQLQAADRPLLNDAADAGVQPALFSSAQLDDWRYLMLRWRPPLPAQPQQPRRDWVFLLDADGSRDPLLARAQVEIVHTLLKHAGHDDTFAVITAGTRVNAWNAQQQAVNARNVAAAAEFLDNMHLVGALDLEQALVSARGFAQAAEKPILVHVGAGIPILGQRDTQALVEQWPADIPYVGVAVGRRWNRTLMRSAASRTGGYWTVINPDESLEWRALELLSALNSPRLLDVQVTADTQQGQFYLFNDSLAQGEQLCAVTRLEQKQPEIGSVTVTGKLDGQPFRHTLEVQHVRSDAGYVPRMWAKLAIDKMLEQDAAGHKAAIVELSKSMYVMSPFTSLLVLENDAMYDQYNVDRGRKDHWALYPCPEKIEVPKELDPRSSPSEPVDTLTDGKRGMVDVLNTIASTAGRASPGQAVDEMYWYFEFSRDADGLGITRWGTTSYDVDDPYEFSVDHLYSFGDYVVGKPVYPTHHYGFVPRHEVTQGRVVPRFAMDGRTVNFFTPPRFDGDDLNGDAWIKLFAPVPDYADLPALITASLDGNGRDLGRVNLNTAGLAIDWPDELKYDNITTVRPKATGQRVLLDSDFVLPRPLGVEEGVLLGGVRFVHEPPIAYPDAAFWSRLRNPVPQHNDQPLRKQLEQKSNFNYQDATVHDIVLDISRRLNVPLVRREEAIANHEGADEKKLTIALHDVSVLSALKLILAKFDLTFYVEKGTLFVTTEEDLQQQLALRSQWLEERLLLLPVFADPDASRSVAKRTALPPSTRRQLVDTWARRMQGSVLSTESQALLYPELPAGSDDQTFRRLTQFAPGTCTTLSDVLAVLEAEAQWKGQPRVGTVDDQARQLIDAARQSTWQSISRDGHSIVISGAGKFRTQRKTQFGLTEIVICDGVTLRHYYPELGLATTRPVSRFHRRDLTALVPWYLPPAEDLAQGADVRQIGPHTVAIVPHDSAPAEQADQEQPDEAQSPQPTRRVHLQFRPSGGLSEVQWVELPSNKVLRRTVFDENGTVAWYDDGDEPLTTTKWTVAAADAPDLTAPAASLVVIPMPARTREYVREQIARQHRKDESPRQDDPLKQIVADLETKTADDPAAWTSEQASQMLSACLVQDSEQLRDIVGRHFFAQGDRRIGLYTLMLSSGANWSVRQPVELADKTTVRMNPVKDHPSSPLAWYMLRELEAAQGQFSNQGSPAKLDPNAFLDQLSEYRRLCAEWSCWRDLTTDAKLRQQKLDELFNFVERCDSPRSALILLRRLQRRLGHDQPHARIAQSLLVLEKKGVTSFVVQYELARSLAATGKTAQARQLYLHLFRETLDLGLLPPIDQAFWQCLKDIQVNPFADTPLLEKGLPGLLRAASDTLVAHQQRLLAIMLAWQCRQLGDQKLADRLFENAVAGADEQDVVTSLAAVNYLRQFGQQERALEYIRPLLEQNDYRDLSALWQWAAMIAESAGRVAQSVRYREQALDLEFQNLPPQYNVQAVQRRYAQLLGQYQQLAITSHVNGDPPDEQFLRRIIQAADRWRMLDTDVTASCQQASRLLASLGADLLAWDYLTTPLSQQTERVRGVAGTGPQPGE